MLSMVSFLGCEADFEDPVLNIGESSAPSITSPAEGTSLTLVQDQAADTVLTVEWNPVDYSLDNLAAPRYVVQLDLAGNDFVAARDMAAVNASPVAFTHQELNNALIQMELEPGVAHQVQIRVTSSLNDNAQYENLNSAPVTLTVTPYDASVVPEAAVLYVPGDYQGWAPDAAPNVYSPESNGMYRGYIHMAEGSGAFKFTAQPDWNGTNYGAGAAPGTLDTDPGAGNLEVPSNGTWYFTVDTEALTWTSQLREFALIGSFNEWEGDEPLTWNEDDQVFTATLDLAAGAEFKFRANESWDFNYGDSDDDGVLDEGADNLAVPEDGNYTIILDLYAVNPTYQIIKN